MAEGQRKISVNSREWKAKKQPLSQLGRHVKENNNKKDILY